MTEVSWFNVPWFAVEQIRPICIRNCTRQKQSFSLPPSLCDTSLIRWRQVLSLECSARYGLISAGASPPPYFNEILSDEIICDDEVFTTFRWSPAMQGLLVCRLPTHSQKGASRPRMHFCTVYCIKPTIFCQYIFPFLLIFCGIVMTVIHKIQQFFLKK